MTPSTEPTMVNPEDSKVETSNPVVEIDTSKEAQSDGNDDTATNTPASVTTAVDENPVDNSPNATTTMPNHAKGVDSDAEATEATNTKDNTPGTTAPTDTDPTMEKESPTKSEVDPTATSLPDSKVVETATETTVNEDKGNKTDDDEPTVTNLTTSKDSAIQPKSDPAASLQSNDKAVEAAIENNKIAEKEGHQPANTQPAITDVTTDKIVPLSQKSIQLQVRKVTTKLLKQPWKIVKPKMIKAVNLILLKRISPRLWPKTVV